MSVLLTNTFADIHCNFGNMEVTRYVQIKQKKKLLIVSLIPPNQRLKLQVIKKLKVKVIYIQLGLIRTFLKKKFIYLFSLFIFGRVGSSLLCAGFLQLWRVGATPHCSAWASHCSGFSCCGAPALGARASVVVAHGLQQLWHAGLVAPQHVGSSWTRAQTCVPCIGRQILYHCATREFPGYLILLHLIIF